MATTPQFRTLLINVLHNPRDRARGYALARWLVQQKHPRAAIIRESFERGVAIFNSYRSGGSSDGTPPVVLIVIQLLPQPVAVEFACDCVEPVMEYLAEIYPASDDRPRNLLNTIRAWATGSAKKRDVANATEAFGELVRRSSLIPDDSEDDEERDAIGQATCASDALGWLETAVLRSPSSPNWWSDISGCLIEVHYAASDRRLPAAQRRELIRIIQERDLAL